jgi:predicted O-linked N-acetylglucosamine transferase (SPINDLY family)
MTDPFSQMNRAFESGDYSGAKEILNRHLMTNPSDTGALYFLGVVEQAMNSWDAALSLFDRVLALDPLHARAHYNKALLLMSLDKHEDALRHHALAVQLDPQNFWARLNRGNSFAALKKFDKAINDYQIVISMAPNLPEAWGNKGNVLRELKQPEEALASYDHALKLKPEYAEAWSSRGNVLYDLRRPEEALVSYDHALTLKPDYPEALNNRGIALLDLKRCEAALASYDKALAVQPGFGDALYGRGNALYDLKRYEEAVASYEKALAIRPDFQYGTGMLANTRMHCCDWRERDEEVERLTLDIRAGKSSVYPFAYLGISDSPRDQLLCSRIWVRDRCSASPASLWNGERYQHDRIRLAYLSADFHEHATAYLMAELFEAHDRARFETTAISFGPDSNDGMRARLSAAFGRFIDVRNRGDREVAALLRKLEIDIAVDLKGFTAGARAGILSHRAAPVQVNYLGYPGTMGADFIDYILADRFVIPEEHYACYTEKVVYLPDTYQVNDSKRVIAERTPTRAEVELPDTDFVFCCFNNNYKITPEIFDCWMRLLNEVQGSVLWLLEDNATASRNLRREAEARGVASERLVFAPRVKLQDHLARQRLADLFLDTLPCTAHTTGSDALWAGLPLLTCHGTTFPGRVAASLLNAVGLRELIAYSLEEYEALALKLATSPAMLNDIRARLAQNRHTHSLFNTDRFRRHIEAAYTTMWERYQRGEPPESFAVEPIDK